MSDSNTHETVPKPFDNSSETVSKNNPPGTKPLITVEKYNEMYSAYRERQSVAHVAETCQVHWKTARRYIEDGDLKRHLRPIKIRFAEVMLKSHAQEDYGLVKANSEMRRAARAMFSKYVQRIQKMKPEEIDPNKIAASLRELQAVILKSFGEADLVVEARGRFEGWSLEELSVYAETGVAPDRDKALAT